MMCDSTCKVLSSWGAPGVHVFAGSQSCRHTVLKWLATQKLKLQTHRRKAGFDHRWPCLHKLSRHLIVWFKAPSMQTLLSEHSKSLILRYRPKARHDERTFLGMCRVQACWVNLFYKVWSPSSFFSLRKWRSRGVKKCAQSHPPKKYMVELLSPWCDCFKCPLSSWPHQWRENTTVGWIWLQGLQPASWEHLEIPQKCL